MVIYVSPQKPERKVSEATDLKRLIISEIIDSAIHGVTILDSSGVPVIHHLPNTLTAKTLRHVANLVEVINVVRQNHDESLGDLQYIYIKYVNYKVGIFELPGGKGWLIAFISPLWQGQMESLLPKIRQFAHKISQSLP
ncbi:MAG: hypothetical protein LM577_00495 [Thermoproteaceae archaeon]|nr:hypothetical protein [Thermoproteaceae archaeon]